MCNYHVDMLNDFTLAFGCGEKVRACQVTIMRLQSCPLHRKSKKLQLSSEDLVISVNLLFLDQTYMKMNNGYVRHWFFFIAFKGQGEVS